MPALASIWPWALALVLVMAIVIVVLLVLVLRKSAKREVIRVGEEEEEEDAVDGVPTPQSADDAGMASAFARAREVMKSLCDGDPYRNPFYLLLGAEDSHEPGFLTGAAGTSLNLVTADPIGDNLAFGSGSQFLFFPGGAVLDVVGAQVLAADGVSADDHGWKKILRELREMRPKRPVDGVVLTVSATELLHATNDVERLKLSARAVRIQRKLWDVQRELGFRMPVYVLVTGCETLQGFTEMCAGLPESAREELLGQIVGWSSPYATQAPYRSEWIDEAFDLIHAKLIDVQLSLFAGRAQSSGMLFLPWSLRGLKSSLRTLLSHLFKASAYHDGAIFRGFYFCGREGAATAFVDQLFSQKIFREVGLAVPTSRTRMVRNRQVRALQAATAAVVLVLFGGLALAAWKFARQKEVIKPLLEDSRTAMMTSPAVDDKVTADEAGKLLEGMARIRFSHYGSVFVPSSWFSDFNDQLDLAMQQAFGQVILTSLAGRLEEKVTYAIDRATQRIVTETRVQPQRETTWGTIASEPYGETITAIDQLDEFKRLQAYMQDLGEIEMKGRMLQDLAVPKRGDLKMLGEVVEYAFGRKLSPDFYRRGGFYETALRSTGATNVEQFRPDRYRPQTSDTARQLTDALYDRLFTRNPFQSRLRQLKADLDNADVNRSYDVSRFNDLVRDIRRIEADLSRPQLQWAFRPKFDLGPEFTHVLNAIQSSQFIAPDAAANIRSRGEAEWGNFRLTLAERTRLTGPILFVKDGVPERRLSSDTQMLQSALQAFLNQSFVSTPIHHASLTRELPPHTRLVWNARLLDQTGETYRAYERFREKGLKMFAPELWTTVDSAARARLRAQMTDLLVEAQQLEPAPPPVSPGMLEEEIRSGVVRFAATQPVIERDIDVFTALGLEDVRGDLTAITTAEALRLLRALDTLLEQESPYTPRQGGFSWWDGRTPASPSAWDAKDPAALAAYLDATRVRVAGLARNYATPLMTWFKDGSTANTIGDDRVVAKWQSIIDDLRDAEEKKPGNAPAVLDEYITTHMTRVTVNDCAAAQLVARPGRIRGWFASRVLQLSDDLGARCSIAAADVAIERYKEIASYFNRRLAGRYPFSDSVPKTRDIEADSDDIRQFFALYDRNAGLFRSIDMREGYASQLRSGVKFLESMKDVRKFFASFLDVEKPQRTPTFEIEPNFRTLQSLEYGANEIIEWTLTIGSKRLTERDKGKKLTWAPGMPVSLSLRWAGDSTRVPVLIGERRGVTVEGRTIRYEYMNRWSLLTSLADLAAATDQLGPDIDAPPVTLALVVNTKPAKGGAAEELPAQAFMRLTLLGKDDKPVDLPSMFPARAPQLERLTAEEVR
jgi:type VI secretion system protein ImpL